MLDEAAYSFDDLPAQRALVRQYPWALLVSGQGAQAPRVSPVSVLVDEAAPDLTLLSHLAKPDAAAHALGERPVTLVVQGPFGYISPAWYGPGPYVPTCDYMTIHVSGRPELLDEAATFEVIRRTAEQFEAARPQPWDIAPVAPLARRITRLTTGFRLRPAKVQAKAKLSQDKPPEVVARVIERLRDPAEPYANEVLARAIAAWNS
ncbi:MAG: FMN-binding negative transcriptional regulator [Bifidobacteriaceae bacterium]|nr:FMN-binding negative transcriptional regulator [Bifidobacteriaceae bacterium]